MSFPNQIDESISKLFGKTCITRKRDFNLVRLILQRKASSKTRSSFWFLLLWLSGWKHGRGWWNFATYLNFPCGFLKLQWRTLSLFPGPACMSQWLVSPSMGNAGWDFLIASNLTPKLRYFMPPWVVYHVIRFYIINNKMIDHSIQFSALAILIY